jgi:hypothetical protein
MLETYSDDTDSTTVHEILYIAVNPAILKLGSTNVQKGSSNLKNLTYNAAIKSKFNVLESRNIF